MIAKRLAAFEKLRASQGNFAASADARLQNDASEPQAQDAATPPASGGFWYLVAQLVQGFFAETLGEQALSPRAVAGRKARLSASLS